MRTRHVIAIAAIAAVVLVGVGVKATQLSSVQAQYGDGARVPVSTWSTDQILNAGNLPVENFHDMSFIFADGDATPGAIAAAVSAPRNGSLTPRCAERDLQASTVIEEFGRLEDMPSAWLAQAGLDWLQARGYCLAGAEKEGVDLFDRIIAGRQRMPNEQAMHQRVTQ